MVIARNISCPEFLYMINPLPPPPPFFLSPSYLVYLNSAAKPPLLPRGTGVPATAPNAAVDELTPSSLSAG